MTSHSDAAVTDNDGTVVAVTVATTNYSVGNGAVATRDAYMRPLREVHAVATVGDDRTVAVEDGHVRPVFDGAMFLDDAMHDTDGNHP